MKSKKIFFENLSKSNFFFIQKFKKEYRKFINNGKYILSESVDSFEKSFAKYIGTNYCVGVGNGLDALTISLKLLNLPKYSEVLVASNAYFASILSIINANLKPILVEPNIKTYNIDVFEIQKHINKRTKVIMAVNLYGKPCDLIEIKKICLKNKLFLIEDCAQSHGASINKKLTGSFGDFGCFSFYPTKNLGALGDGGAIVCNNKNISDKLKKFRNYGSINRYHNEILGINSRLDEFQAAFLNIKLKYLEKINNHKNILANIYNKFLKTDFIKPIKETNVKDSYYLYTIRHPHRNKIRDYLMKYNIHTDVHYPTPPYKQPCFLQYFNKKKFSISEEIHNSIMSLPISFAHTKDQIYRVIEILNKY